MFAGKKSAQIREILISESAWEEMTCLFAPSLDKTQAVPLMLNKVTGPPQKSSILKPRFPLDDDNNENR
ncbi:hypothetical protein ABCT34_002994 [Proteus mirabilis]